MSGITNVIEEVSAKYCYLASWSGAAGWRRARFRFLVSLTYAQLYRADGSSVVYDSDGIL